MTLFSSFVRTSCVVITLTALPGAVVATQELPSARELPEVQVDPPAHVSVVDGVAVLERDGEIDDAPANMPLLAGDRVRTRNGRVEILFADGATLHLDVNTVVDFQSDELVRLLDGRIRLSIPGPLRAVSYRVDAPTGWAQITQPGEYRLALLRTQRGEELELAVLRGGAELLTDTGRTSLRAGERAYARASAAPSSAYVFNSASWDAFDRWSEAERDYRLGVSTQYLPDEVRPYAASFDRYGSWRSDPSHGYVWYPTVSADWRPYYHGRWVAMPSYGWTWVGRERWDWPTHHYGRWGVSGGVWFWIPGRTWSTAWVSWAYAPDYVSWSPLGWNNRPLIQINVFTGRDRWHPWTVVPRRHFGIGYVHARAVPFRDFDSRTRGSFAYRHAAPDVRGHARPRATVPIRTAGARTGRAVPRGSSPIYTNLGPDASRVDRGSRRVMVAPSASRPEASREGSPAIRGGGQSDTTPRADADRRGSVARSQVPAPAGARQRSSDSANRIIAVAPPASAPDDADRRGVRATPRIDRGPAPLTSAPSRNGVQRGPERGTPADANPGVRRGRTATEPRGGGSPERIMSAPPAGTRQASPRAASPPSSYDGATRAPRAPESARPAAPRGVSRGERPAAGSSGSSRPAEARPSSRGESRAQPAERPSQSQGAPGARPRSGGERPSGTGAPRRRGGV